MGWGCRSDQEFGWCIEMREKDWINIYLRWRGRVEVNNFHCSLVMTLASHINGRNERRPALWLFYTYGQLNRKDSSNVPTTGAVRAQTKQ